MKKIDKVLTIEEMKPVVGGVVRTNVRIKPTRTGPVVRRGNVGHAIGNAITNLMLYFLHTNDKNKSA